MKRTSFLFIIVFVLATGVTAVYGQQHQTPPAIPKSTPPPESEESASRDAIREKVRAALIEAGPKLGVAFKQASTQPYNFTGVLKTGLKSAEAFEIIVSVGEHDTVHFRVFPHFNGGYINLDKVKNSAALARQMVRFSDTKFFYWGADDSFDIFAGYNFTLESGFPEESFKIVLLSIPKLDAAVEEMRPAIVGVP